MKGYIFIGLSIVLLVVWFQIVNISLALMSAPSDIKLYSGIALLFASTPAIITAHKLLRKWSSKKS